jgi:sugar phosphate isomerase/epimerase
MRLYASTLALGDLPLEDFFSRVARLNFQGVEVMIDPPRLWPISHEDQRKIAELADLYRLDLSVHAPLSDINLASLNETMRQASLAEMRRAVDVAADWGAGWMVFHPGHLSGVGAMGHELALNRLRDSLEELLAYAAERGLSLSLENHHRTGDLASSLAELRGILSWFDDRLGFTLDIGHAYLVAGDAVPDYIIELGPSLRSLHIDDNAGEGDVHAALGLGKIRLDDVFQALQEIGYDGDLVLELWNLPDLASSLELLRTRGLLAAQALGPRLRQA